METTRVDELVTRVAALAADERDTILDEECKGDADLRYAVTEALSVQAVQSSRLADLDLKPGQDIGPYRHRSTLLRHGVCAGYLDYRLL